MSTKVVEQSRQKVSSKNRMNAFAKTIKDGVSDDYINYLKKEAKENRIIEKYL